MFCRIRMWWVQWTRKQGPGSTATVSKFQIRSLARWLRSLPIQSRSEGKSVREWMRVPLVSVLQTHSSQVFVFTGNKTLTSSYIYCKVFTLFRWIILKSLNKIGQVIRKLQLFKKSMLHHLRPMIKFSHVKSAPSGSVGRHDDLWSHTWNLFGNKTLHIQDYFLLYCHKWDFRTMCQLFQGCESICE